MIWAYAGVDRRKGALTWIKFDPNFSRPVALRRLPIETGPATRLPLHPICLDLRLQPFQRGGGRGAIDQILSARDHLEHASVDVRRVVDDVAVIMEVVSDLLDAAE